MKKFKLLFLRFVNQIFMRMEEEARDVKDFPQVKTTYPDHIPNFNEWCNMHQVSSLYEK